MKMSEEDRVYLAWKEVERFNEEMFNEKMDNLMKDLEETFGMKMDRVTAEKWYNAGCFRFTDESEEELTGYSVDLVDLIDYNKKTYNYV